MTSHLVIDGNAFYEIDDECMKKKQAIQKKQEKEEKSNKKNSPDLFEEKRWNNKYNETNDFTSVII